ncbi:MAG: heavy-metal-associated domain-containing protein [Bacteroidetes bacterium]|nr:heavy-metal-associated domain-containing protein [Bacteroidota bacterium]
MTHRYKIIGMTCDSCQTKVQDLLSKAVGVRNVNANWHTGEAEFVMKKHIDTSVLQNALRGTRYKITEKQENIPHIMEEVTKSRLQTYKPVLLLFAYITAASFLVQLKSDTFSWMMWMRHFMAGFFLSFSFFKLINLSGFADSYSTYDVVAKKWRGYGFLYPFIELGLGFAFLSGIFSLVINTITLVVMSVSLIGVLQSVLNKRKIRCACLGDVFNLPMSTITIIEDALMIAMSLFMIVFLKA